MPLLRGIFGITLILGSVVSIGAAQPTSWTPGSYRGLMQGHSTRQDVLRTLGKPNYESQESETETPLWGYSVSTPVRVDLQIYFDGAKVIGVQLNFEHELTIEQFAGIFGSDYKLVRVSIEDCDDAPGVGRGYRDPNGSTSELDMPRLGIVASLATEGTVNSISYKRQPLPAKRPKCRLRHS